MFSCSYRDHKLVILLQVGIHLSHYVLGFVCYVLGFCLRVFIFIYFCTPVFILHHNKCGVWISNSWSVGQRFIICLDSPIQLARKEVYLQQIKVLFQLHQTYKRWFCKFHPLKPTFSGVSYNLQDAVLFIARGTELVIK